MLFTQRWTTVQNPEELAPKEFVAEKSDMRAPRIAGTCEQLVWQLVLAPGTNLGMDNREAERVHNEQEQTLSMPELGHVQTRLMVVTANPLDGILEGGCRRARGSQPWVPSASGSRSNLR
jgi:hypothetical protein